MKKTKIFLTDLPLETAQITWERALNDCGFLQVVRRETVALDEKAVGRVLAEAIWAKMSSPHYYSSAMDGFAVDAKATIGAIPGSPVILNCSFEKSIQAIYVDTGDPLPMWANAVIPIENVEPLFDLRYTQDPRKPGAIKIRESVPPWSHIRPLGEDIVMSELVFPPGHVLRPADLGAIASAGYSTISVSSPPKVGIIPTGSELVPVGTFPKEGEILEYNSIMLAAQVKIWGGEAIRYPVIPDVFSKIKEQVKIASEECDLVLINAGSSAGSEDFTAQVVESLGIVLVHGVAIKPGHPVVLGILNNNKPIIGVPGYPVSTILTGEIFVEPLIARWLGRRPFEPQIIVANMTRKITSPAGDDEYLRVVVGKVGTRTIAAPLPRGAGRINSFVRADGIVIIPRGSQGLPAGAKVNVHLYRPERLIDETIFMIGSHDILLDILASHLNNRNRRLVSSNVGSLGGLLALRRGEAHLAGSHLLDPDTGKYNIPYITKYLSGLNVKVIAFADRIQGFILQKGNPKNITTLQDLTSPDVRFVNRQKGAGTRVLLDYYLKNNKINSNDIYGYDYEEFTHLAVASAVKSNRVDCALGIEAAARALNLDFVPLFSEKYQIVTLKEFHESGRLKPFFEMLSDQKFIMEIKAIPGYNISEMGKIVFES